jgi:hypothetical protein
MVELVQDCQGIRPDGSGRDGIAAYAMGVTETTQRIGLGVPVTEHPAQVGGVPGCWERRLPFDLGWVSGGGLASDAPPG